ncbi:MAG TPA: NAD+ synthase [Solirubrobacteraceae bacterium]|nr:NAD+ synthase [Solirubrobacteraceae bacterium]
MSTGLRLALCQMNATVGDLAGNANRIREGIAAAGQAGADVVLFPELALTGYPPEDLLLREHFLTDTGAKLHELAATVAGTVAIVGFPERAGGHIHNSVAVLAGGRVCTTYRKVHLPNYGVFDEQRYFKAGDPSGAMIEVGGHRIGLTVCEDLWVAGPPASTEAAAGASLIVNISASPYHAGKGMERERLFGQRARETSTHIAFCAMVGGQDELVFDGHSFVLDPAGETIARAAQFEEDLLVCDLMLAPQGRQAVSAKSEQAYASVSAARPAAPPGAPTSSSARPAPRLRAPISSSEEEIYEALLLGLRDYVRKNGFEAVVLGLSGGIDSALVACLAADALGPRRVNVAIMPSPYSSSATQDDARTLARALGVRVHELPIERAMGAYAKTLSAGFEGLERDLTEENLQARIRGNLLMALSNKFGWLVLTTGNKSEMSVGYTTLYGDLAGGFAVIKDVPKTLVYRLARRRNAAAAAVHGRVPTPIPPTIVERPPSAELRENQIDQDSLPPYDVLDRILHGYVELDRGREQLIAEGLPAADVERATRLVDVAEYKRRQAPPGIKITERAFGRDRRMPITNAYRG